MQKHLFILDPLESLNMALDSSLRLAYELHAEGCEVYSCELGGLSWRSHESAATAQASPIVFGSSINLTRLGTAAKIPLDQFDAIHMRKDPPFDMNYVAATWLLESAAQQTTIFNHPAALRGLNEKLAVFMFPDESSDSVVSSDPEILLEFIENRAHGDAVLKPLTLFGGRGVIRLKLNSERLARSQMLTQLKQETDNGRVLRIAQPFNARVFDGEVRCFAVGGKPLAWCLKKPASGNFLANTAAGATLAAYKPTKSEIDRVTQVGTELLKHGVYIVGFDMIGGVISEINITSPRLLTGQDDTTNYYKPMAAWVLAFVKNAK